MAGVGAIRSSFGGDAGVDFSWISRLTRGRDGSVARKKKSSAARSCKDRSLAASVLRTAEH